MAMNDFGHLPVTPPFDLASTLESGQAHRWQREGGWYWGVVHGNLIKIRQNAMALEIYSAPLPPDTLLDTLKNYFRLDDDLSLIYGEINRDPRIDEMIRKYSGLRLLRQEPWECLVAFICSATSSIPRIASNMESIAEAFGDPVSLHNRIRYTFPPAKKIAAAGEQALRDLRLGFRAKYLIQAATRVAEGLLDLDELKGVSYWDAKARLMEIPGIGAKIADCVLAFSLDKLEAFPIDRWVSRAIAEWYFDNQTLSYKETVTWAHSYYGRYAGYAQQYLFHGGRLSKVGRVAMGRLTN